ncbi:DUF960 domain-containing protein [Levilactobacillus spicheri]|uniref:GTP cyclohydrolase n=2 Tax=Levilactobacillus spicheri TaxID=216463 RepID=A0A0F3RTA5_9LACO|nr:DUF960 domain-containing protein [Levilactobacillus spicheri]KJW12017.1 hypothetical protein VC81_10620 [Levilactobacillus spicheri]KRL50405.1 hypothetical protein FD37_GL002070 [Levilactobacillus spicheri DSM 15429]GEO67280.1 GTP cyclohydrolase [Levilactobacillus spicheri]
MFESDHARYASYGTVAVLPGEMIDAVWEIIDHDLQGLFPLENLLTFKLHDNQGQTTYEYVQTDDDKVTLRAAFDTQYAYSDSLPETVLAYDDGDSQIILLPSETAGR